LRDLVVELRYRELRQQISDPDAIADVDGALGDIAGRTGINARGGEGRRGPWQSDGHGGRAGLDRRSLQLWFEVRRVLREGHGLLLLRVVLPPAHRKSAGKQQECRERKQTPARAATRSVFVVVLHIAAANGAGPLVRAGHWRLNS
jgi:hypothetical protein